MLTLDALNCPKKSKKIHLTTIWKQPMSRRNLILQVVAGDIFPNFLEAVKTMNLACQALCYDQKIGQVKMKTSEKNVLGCKT